MCVNLIFYFWTCYEIYFKSILNFMNMILKLLKDFVKNLKWKEENFFYAFSMPFHFYRLFRSNVLILCLVHSSFRDTVRFRKRIRVSAHLNFAVRGMNGKRGMIFTHALHHRRYKRSYVIRNLLLLFPESFSNSFSCRFPVKLE